MKSLRSFAILVAVMMFFSMFAGCSRKDRGTESDKSNSSAQGNSSTKNEDNKKEEKKQVTITMFNEAKKASTQFFMDLIADFEKQSGYKVEQNILPGDGAEIYKKLDIAFMSGDKTDAMHFGSNAQALRYSESGTLHSLDQLAKDKNVDVESKYDKYLQRAKDGNLYLLPLNVTMWAVYYNKDIFDAAGVSYPDGTWTWDEYIETAKKLNNPEKGIYGSYMPTYDNIMYFKTRMYDIPGYNEEGISNYDHPMFKEALNFFHELSAVHKIQPSWVEQKAKKWGSKEFMSGRFGMIFISNWYNGVIADKNKYPRDWKVGVTKIPYFTEEGKNNFGNLETVAINKNAEHPKEAFEFIEFLSDYWYRYEGSFPAQKNFDRKEMENILLTQVAEKTEGEVSLKDLTDTFLDSGFGFTSEKIIGPVAAEYSSIIKQEGEQYFSGQKSLDDAIKSIKERADKAIKEDLNKN